MEQERYVLLKTLGYVEVSDCFWAEKGMPIFVGQGFGWAYKRHESYEQKYMPYTEQKLIELTDDELRFRAQEHCNEAHEMIETPKENSNNEKQKFEINLSSVSVFISIFTCILVVLSLFQK